MKIGDLVKPKGYQQIVNRSKVKGVKAGIIINEVRKKYDSFTVKKYTVLWDNKKVIEHSWMEIELL